MVSAAFLLPSLKCCYTFSQLIFFIVCIFIECNTMWKTKQALVPTQRLLRAVHGTLIYMISIFSVAFLIPQTQQNPKMKQAISMKNTKTNVKTPFKVEMSPRSRPSLGYFKKLIR